MKTAQKLQQENAKLRAEIQAKDELLIQKSNDIQVKEKQLKNQTADIKAKEQQLKDKIAYIQNLEAALIELKKHRFGASSEKQNANDAQVALFNEAEVLTEPKAKKGKKKKSGKRKPLPKTLEREDKVYKPEQTTCPHDGTELTYIGDEVSEQLQFIPAHVKVIRHIRHKLACPKCKGYIVTADKPKDPIPKSIATPELLSYITVSKYADGLPLYRLSQMFKRLDISISRTNMADWMIKCATLVQPLINLLEDKLLDEPVMYIDETTVQVLNEPGKKASSKSYMWVRRSDNIILFDYSPSRSSQVAKKLTADYKGTLMSDGYDVYKTLANNQLGCWTHARRYFIKVLDNTEHAGARKMIELIAELYQVENQTKDDPQDKSAAILEKIKTLKDESLLSCTPTSTFGKALGYLHNQWPKLIAYIEDGRYPIDNNPAENAIRPFVIGRKNWLFANSQNGAKASANLYGLIETAKAHGLNPEKYLTKIYRQLPNCETAEQFEQLLPENIQVD
ncbi:IS66 family transposase [Marinicella gelatinilytica]|uniref:IS66 family transposase n=1 Tax=Marinicella gelatinilytica TaxID=2996017 RepID=UPI002260E5CD|nr:IS66 family transposase [Marinicella gelatinilytica]MCX7545348.1 IS66 family transposase [Marinicella gelatinilytica]